MSQLWKNLICFLFSCCFCASLKAACEDPFIQHWHNSSIYTLTVKGGTPWHGQNLAPAVGTMIGSNIENDWVLFNELSVDITTAEGTHMGTADLNYSNGTIIDKNGLITLAYNDPKSHYETDCWKCWRFFDLNVSVAPSILSNAGWDNGLGNSESALVAGNSYWGVDYGVDRWSIHDGAAYQTTAKSQYNGVGSRAFAFHLVTAAPDYKTGNGPGNAMDGLWQIDIKIGSNGDDNFCETFYLAERFDLTPGVHNYYDGAGGGQDNNYAHWSREIDILETHWQPDGPQINVTYNAGHTQYWNNQLYQSKKMGSWSDVGGAPTGKFVTFGALIRENNLWIYAYKPDGTLWYCTDAIPNNNPEYVQKGVFVPYIGTWSNGGDALFETGYKHFIYLDKDNSKIAGKNPKDHPEAFGPALKP
jgi:hypothetical protein